MATSNFHYENTSKIYVFDVEDEYDWKERMLEIESAIKDDKKFRFLAGDGKDTNEIRSYPSQVIGTLHSSKSYNEFEISINVVLVARAGYYEAACFDWLVTYDINGYETDLAYFGEAIGDYCSTEMAAYKAGLALKWVERTAKKMTTYAEEIFNQFSETYKTVARFSNGETLYEKIEK